MRKIILLILTGLLTLVNAQQQNGAEMNMGITQPNPMASSMSSYANVPVSIQTGIPNISYDLFTVPTNHKKINIKLALNYHAGGIGSSQWVGDMGQGWSLLGLGAVSREIYGDIDERFSQNFSQYYKKNIFDDIYSFSTLEESGRFRFKRDTVNNIFSLKAMSDYASRIEYERTADNKTLVLNSFTVTGTSGVKYKYTLHDRAVQTNVFMHYTTQKVKAKDGITDSLISKPKYLDLDYRSSFRLASILNENNIEIVKYNYESYNDVVGTSSITQKLRSIEIKDQGKIEINYTSDFYPRIRNHESLKIASIVLKDINAIQVQKYVFSYDGDHSSSTAYGVQPRQLMSYSKVDKNNNIIENTQFNYNLASYLVKPMHNIYTYIWHLKNVILPTGGKIEYDFNFEPNFWHEFETSTPKYADLSIVSFQEYNNSNKKPFFTLNEDKTVIISLQNQAPGQFWEFSLYKKNGNSYDLISPTLGYFNIASSYSLSSGEYYASLHYNWANSPAFTEATVFTSVYQDGFEKYTEASERGFLRINNIKYYSDKNAVSSDLNEAYDYRDFEDSSKSSGHAVGNCLYLDLGLGENSPVAIIYKNVKVSGKGYTKYYYKIPEDYPLIETNYYTQRENNYSTQGGVLDKTEIYDDNHQKLKEIKHTYNFVDFGDLLPEAGLYGERYKLSYTQSEKTVTKDFLPTGISETQNEIIRNDISNININKNNVIMEKQTDSDQTVTETHYKYAAEKSNHYLTDKNIVSTVLEKETKKNGKMISKTETVYPTNQSAADTKTAGKALPYQVNSTDLLNVISTDFIYDAYDLKGNILQYTPKDGVVTSVIWGYNSTQPIAKITGVSFAVANALAADIISASDADVDAGTEQNLIYKLDLFRKQSALQNAQISTYTYDPLIGVTSITPPSGIREIYKYDSANRLENIKDINGKLLKEFKYNYKH